jgi:hypothetical protein
MHIYIQIYIDIHTSSSARSCCSVPSPSDFFWDIIILNPDNNDNNDNDNDDDNDDNSDDNDDNDDDNDNNNDVT